MSFNHIAVIQLRRWAMMGAADEAVIFIRECLHMDDVIEVLLLLPVLVF